MKKDWIETRLDMTCEIHDDLRAPVNAKERSIRIKGKRKSELYPYYGATGQVGFIDGYLTDGEYVLVGEDGAPFYDLAKNTAYMIDGKAWVNNHAHILRSHFSNKFLLHYLNQFDFHGYVSGTTRLKLTQKSLRKIPTKIAPLPDQRAIVAKLERLFSELDNGVANLKAAREKLKIYRQSVLKTAFDGKLLSSEQLKKCRKETDYEPAGDLLEKIGLKAVYPKSQIREDWAEAELGKVCKTKSGGTPSRKMPEYYTGNIPWIKSGELNYNIICNSEESISELAIQKSSAKIFPKNTLLIALYGATIGKIAILGIPASTNQAVCAIFQNRFIETRYLFNYLSYKRQNLIKQSFGGAQPNISQSIIRKLIIPIPPLPEQRAIVSAIESRFAVCDKLARSMDEALEKSQAMRQSILKRAFDGELLSEAELRECRKQPDWEPAEKLLQHIKESKPPKPAKRKK